jgi:tripartite-type tricarboxylate transporter receptor subunit TctC
MCVVLFAIGTPAAHAQAFPIKPIRVIVPFPPGGGTDATARILTQAFAETSESDTYIL